MYVVGQRNMDTGGICEASNPYERGQCGHATDALGLSRNYNRDIYENTVLSFQKFSKQIPAKIPLIYYL